MGATAAQLTDEQQVMVTAVNWVHELFDHDPGVIDIDFDTGSVAIMGPQDEVIKFRTILNKLLDSAMVRLAERRIETYE